VNRDFLKPCLATLEISKIKTWKTTMIRKALRCATIAAIKSISSENQCKNQHSSAYDNEVKEFWAA
jgi:hypothetical protein